MRFKRILWLLPLLLIGLAAYGWKESAKTTNVEPQPSPSRLQVSIINEKGKKIGEARLSQVPKGVKIQIAVSHLPPGAHGFHFHESAQCDPPDFKSAGEHFNPEGKQHGFENPLGYHAGDLPNLLVGADGTAKAEVIAAKVTLQRGKPNSLLKPGGTSLMIHEKADDYKTDPAGNAGARIACGPIK